MISKPTVKSEFEIHAELFIKLKSDGFDVHGCVSHSGEGWRAILDLVIFKGEYPFALIEVKKKDLSWSVGQNEIYSLCGLGLPIFLYNELSDYKQLILDLRSIKIPKSRLDNVMGSVITEAAWEIRDSPGGRTGYGANPAQSGKEARAMQPSHCLASSVLEPSQKRTSGE